MQNAKSGLIPTVDMECTSCVPSIQKYYSISRDRRQSPPIRRLKNLLVEAVGQITPAEPYKSSLPTYF